MWHGKRELRDVSGQGESCRRRIEQAASDHRGRKVPYARDVVHRDREVVHGGFPPPRRMEGLRRQREPRRSGKHFKEGRVKEVAYETPGGSITGFPCPLPSCRITLLWLCAFGFMDHKEEQPWCSCRQCLSRQSTGLG